MTRQRKDVPPEDANDAPSEPAFEIKQGDIVWVEYDPEEDDDEVKT